MVAFRGLYLVDPHSTCLVFLYKLKLVVPLSKEHLIYNSKATLPVVPGRLEKVTGVETH